MTLQNAAETKAESIWKDFREYVFYKRRYFIEHKVLDVIKRHIESNNITIDSGRIFYRARIIDKTAMKQHTMYLAYSDEVDEKERPEKNINSFENKFRGLTKEGSFIPLDSTKIPDGRANPKFIKYLYVSEKRTTAIFEVRPLITDRINVAEIQINETLNIADLSVNLELSENEPYEKWIISYLQQAFSKPTNNSDDYMLSQIIAEYVKTLGFDGLRFNSSLHDGGINLTIYNCEKCVPISSVEYNLQEIKITAKPVCSTDIKQGNYCEIIDNEEKLLSASFYKDIQSQFKT